MMQSNRSEYSHKQQYSERSSRQWDDYDDRWEERRDPHRIIPQDSYQKYSGDGHSSTERTRRSREYSDSPKMLYSKDSLNRDWSRDRTSSVRRRASSPDKGTSEKKRRRFTEDDKDDYRYRRLPEDKTNRQSPDSFSRARVTKDSKRTLSQEEDYKYRKTPQDSRHRYRHEEFTHRQQHDDLSFRQSSGYHKDRDGHERSRDFSQERTQSQVCSTKSYAKPRERNDSPFTDHEDYRQNRRRPPLNGSSGQSTESDVTNQSARIPEQKKSTMGFQRFLDVLNKGVNVAELTKIVTQTSTEVDDQPHSPTSFMNADHPCSPSYTGRHYGSHQNISHWSESEGSQRVASPQPWHFSPKGRSPSDEKSLHMGDAERSYFSSNSRSRSPPEVEKVTLTPEDEYKHRQMQDVLQAIGMNLGFEELGQMSHRIQERLYGKKESDGGRHRKGSRERDTRRAFSPRAQSRSSSSRSSFSPLNQEYYKKKDSYSAQRDVTDLHQIQVHEAVEYCQNSSSSTVQESEKCETYSQESTAACQAFSQNSTYTLSKPSPTPVMPMYSPVNCSPLPYPALPPNMPHLGPRLLLPHPPPFLPYPHVPPLNIFPAVLAQTRHLLPQHFNNPPIFNLPGINPVQPLNTTQKSKTLSRPRCLQVIETKQPG